MMDFCLFRKLVGVLFCYGTLWIAAVVSPVEGRQSGASYVDLKRYNLWRHASLGI